MIFIAATIIVVSLYSYAVGGPEVARAMDNRRSYGMESVEDDPFIVAASMQSVNSTEGKKKKQDTGVNYGYLSQGTSSLVQPLVRAISN